LENLVDLFQAVFRAIPTTGYQQDHQPDEEQQNYRAGNQD
jgi:hypothetical protein